jgi:hypothetical protein
MCLVGSGVVGRAIAPAVAAVLLATGLAIKGQKSGSEVSEEGLSPASRTIQVAAVAMVLITGCAFAALGWGRFG